MQTTNISKNGHREPHPGILAIVYTLLFNAGLYQVVSFTGGPHFPGPWESGEAITTYFQTYPKTVLVCAFLQFGAPEELEFLQGSKSKIDLSQFYPVDPTQLPTELAGVEWPAKS